MQFSPKSYEKIIAFARNTVQRRLILEKTNQNLKRQLRAIERFSALKRDVFLQETDIESSLRIFLCACYVLFLKNNKILNFSISGSAFGNTDKNLLFTLLLEIITAAEDEIKIEIKDEKIKITARNCHLGGYLKKLMLRHKIAYFLLNENLCICFQFENAEFNQYRAPDILDLLQNPFSLANLWI